MKILMVVAVLILVQPAFSAGTRGGKAPEKIDFNSRDNSVAQRSVKDLNKVLKRNGLDEIDLSQLRETPAEMGALTESVRRLKQEIEANEIIASDRLRSVMGSVKDIYSRVRDYDVPESEVSGAREMLKTAKNSLNVLRSILEMSEPSQIEAAKEVLAAISNATVSGRITVSGIREIIAVATKYGVRVEELAVCK